MNNAVKKSAPILSENLGEQHNFSMRTFIPYFSLILIFAFFAITAFDRFVTLNNFSTILQQAAVVAIVAFGVHFVVAMGSIDLSVGSIMALSGMIGAGISVQFGFWGILAGIIIGAAMGFINGAVFTWMKIPSFITTLGMMMMARGLTIVYSHSNPIPLDPSLFFLGNYPNIFWLAFGVFVVTFILYNYTTFGRYTIAIGGDERVAKLNGVSVNRGKILVFVLSGVLAGLGGVVMASRLGAATPTAGINFEMSAISAVVLGGTPLTGGIGSMQNTVIGAIITAILANGLVILGISSDIQQIITGVILIIAVFISIDRNKIGIIK